MSREFLDASVAARSEQELAGEREYSEGLRRRHERFAEVEPALEKYESSLTKLEEVVSTLVVSGEARSAARGEVVEKVKNWAVEKVPGVVETRELIAWFMKGISGSIAYSNPRMFEYHPTKFSDVKESFLAALRVHKYATEEQKTDELQQLEDSLLLAQAALTRAVEKLGETGAQEFFDLQKKIYIAKRAADGFVYPEAL